MVKALVRTFVVSLIFIWSASVVSAATYCNDAGNPGNCYVDGNDGLDTNNGKTPSTAWKTIQSAAAVLGPGDTVNVKGGITYSQTSRIRSVNAGTLGNNIVYQAWPGTGTPLIDGNGGNYFWHNKNYQTTQGFRIINSTRGIDSMGTGCVIRNNIIEYPGFLGIYAGGGAEVHNNTLISDGAVGATGIWVLATSGGPANIRNNIIYNFDTGVNILGGSMSYDNNILFSNTTNYVGYPAGPNDLLLDPLFVDSGSGNFRLSKSSPAIGAGADLTASGVTTDILEVARPQGSGFDIGAYEYYDIPVTLTATPITPSTDTTPTLSGTASTISGATISSITYSVDNGSWTSTGVTGTSSWSITIPDNAALSDGSHTIRVRATDSYGNTSDSTLYGTSTFTVDTTSPSQPTVLSPLGYSRDNIRPTLTYTLASDTTSGISSYLVSLHREGKEKLTVDGLPSSFTGTYKDNDQVRVSYSQDQNQVSVYFKALDKEPLSEGKYTWDVVTYDNAGNSSKQVTTFYLDQTNPKLGELTVSSVTSPFPTLTSTTDETEGELTLYITKLVNNKYLPYSKDTISLSNLGTLPTLRLTPKNPLTPGYYQLELELRDKVGNPTTKTVQLTYGQGIDSTNTKRPIVESLLTKPMATNTPIVTPLLSPSPTPTVTPAPTQPSTSQTFWEWLRVLITKLLGQ